MNYSHGIYKKFKWHKKASTTPEVQPHYSMKPLSVDKLNIVILDLILAEILVRHHPLLVSALVPSSKFVWNIALTSLGLLVVVMSNSP